MAVKKINTAFEDAAGTFTPKINQAVDTVKKGVSGIVSGAKDTAISIGEVLGTGTSLGQMAASNKNMAQYKSDESYYGGLLEETEANKPGEYKESEALTNLRGELATVEGQKPDAFVNKYEGQIDALLDKLQSREKFSYDFNTDPNWLALKDQYQRNAILGMQGAIGDAAGLTGGYGNSYAQQVGQQTYQQQISEMTDIIPELHGQALNVWQAENQQMQSNLAALQTQSELDYAQFFNDWQMWNTDRNYMYQKVADMSEDEFNKYMYGVERWQQDRAYYAGQKQIAIQNQQWQLQLDESRRQFNNQLAFNYINMGVGAAVDLTTTGMQVGASLAGTAADFALGVGGLAMDKYEIDQNNEYRYAALAQDDRHFNATMDYNYADLNMRDANADADREYNYAALNQSDRHHYDNLEEDKFQFDATMDYNARENIGSSWSRNSGFSELSTQSNNGNSGFTDDEFKTYESNLDRMDSSRRAKYITESYTYNDTVAYLKALGLDSSSVVTENEFNTYKKNPNSNVGMGIYNGLYEDDYESYLKYKIQKAGGSLQ